MAAPPPPCGEGAEELRHTLLEAQLSKADAVAQFLENGELAAMLLPDRCRVVGGSEKQEHDTLGPQFRGPLRIQVTLKEGSEAGGLPKEWMQLPIETVPAAASMMRLKIVEITGGIIFDDDVWPGTKVSYLKDRLSATDGDWALEENLFFGSTKLNDEDTLDDVPDGTTLCLITSRRTTVSWLESGLKRREASLENFEPLSVVKDPMVRTIMGKACVKGNLTDRMGGNDPIDFGRPIEATEALAAAPHFAEKEGWQFLFTDGTSLSFSKAHSTLGPLYTPLESEERRVKTLGLVFVEENSDAGSVRGWHVPPGWAYKSY